MEVRGGRRGEGAVDNDQIQPQYTETKLQLLTVLPEWTAPGRWLVRSRRDVFENEQSLGIAPFLGTPQGGVSQHLLINQNCSSVANVFGPKISLHSSNSDTSTLPAVQFY